MWGNWYECSKNSWWEGILFVDRSLIQQISNQWILFLMLLVILVIKMIFNNKWKTSIIFYKKKIYKNKNKKTGAKKKEKLTIAFEMLLRFFSE